MGNIPDVGVVEKSYSEVETIRVKANKRLTIRGTASILENNHAKSMQDCIRFLLIR